MNQDEQSSNLPPAVQGDREANGQLKAGHSDAAGKIWHRYVEQLVRHARRKLGRSPRRAVDEEDVVVSAFNGFLQGVDEGRFLKLDDREDLWQVLVMLTERRAIALRAPTTAESNRHHNPREDAIL